MVNFKNDVNVCVLQSRNPISRAFGIVSDLVGVASLANPSNRLCIMDEFYDAYSYVYLLSNKLLVGDIRLVVDNDYADNQDILDGLLESISKIDIVSAFNKFEEWKNYNNVIFRS